MKKIIFFGLFIFAAILMIAVVSSAQKHRNPLRTLIESGHFESCGLDKLNDTEIDGLFRMYTPRAGHDFLNQSAVRYMENNGWRRVNVIGAYMPESIGIDKKNLIVIDNYEPILLDPWSSMENLPDPGYYWAKNSLSSWEMILSDGKTYNFKAVDI
jgi:hypothetical protein